MWLACGCILHIYALKMKHWVLTTISAFKQYIQSLQTFQTLA